MLVKIIIDEILTVKMWIRVFIGIYEKKDAKSINYLFLPWCFDRSLVTYLNWKEVELASLSESIRRLIRKVFRASNHAPAPQLQSVSSWPRKPFATPIVVIFDYRGFLAFFLLKRANWLTTTWAILLNGTWFASLITALFAWQEQRQTFCLTCLLLSLKLTYMHIPILCR
jgi:hypothetical protein